MLINDIEKIDIKITNNRNRIIYRKHINRVYIFVFFLLLLTVCITMCFTFLFNIKKIVVSGESEINTSKQIVEFSGVNVGDNLMRIDQKKISQNILDKLFYIETVDVYRDLFSSIIKINIAKSVYKYSIHYNKGVLLVSQKGKILPNNNVYYDTENLIIIYGFDPNDSVIGNHIVSINKNKDNFFINLIQYFDHFDNRYRVRVLAIDITNEYDIIVYYSNGIEFRMGNWLNVEYKLNIVQNIMNEELIKDKKGCITMIGQNQFSFRSNDKCHLLEETTD